jgi:hypothetical protein
VPPERQGISAAGIFFTPVFSLVILPREGLAAGFRGSYSVFILLHVRSGLCLDDAFGSLLPVVMDPLSVVGLVL